MFTENQEKGIELAKRIVANPSLLTQLDDDTFIKLVVSLSKICKGLGNEIFDLREDIPSENKPLFRELIDILTSEYEDRENESELIAFENQTYEGD